MTMIGAPFTMPPYKHGSTSPDRMPTLLTIPSKNKTQVRLAMRSPFKPLKASRYTGSLLVVLMDDGNLTHTFTVSGEFMKAWDTSMA